MNLKAISTGAFEEICYLVWDAENKALVVDPGHDAERILEILHLNQLQVDAYICTHGHADHINALAELYQKYPAPVAMHAADLKWAFSAANQIPPHYPIPNRPDGSEILHLETAVDWNFADLHFQCIQTPGHTPGSCCLLFSNGGMILTGDTLFKGSCGRTDLPGGDSRQLKESLNLLKKLPGETRVYPGHGPDSTIGIECQTNFFMQ